MKLQRYDFGTGSGNRKAAPITEAPAALSALVRADFKEWRPGQVDQSGDRNLMLETGRNLLAGALGNLLNAVQGNDPPPMHRGIGCVGTQAGNRHPQAEQHHDLPRKSQQHRISFNLIGGKRSQSPLPRKPAAPRTALGMPKDADHGPRRKL
jgi:hypothetical protein